MGKDRSGGYEELAALGAAEGFTVTRVGASKGDGDPISSSRIRDLLAEGRVDEAATLLGHPYRILGMVRPGSGRGRFLAFPTANVAVAEEAKLLPASGVYALRAKLPGEASFRPAVMNWGTRPTFGGGEPVLEVHLPGWNGDLSGAELVLDLVARIRPERRFEGPDALRAAIAADVREARKILGAGE
jgi:riboflavin kinase/FMN adenylyltransferase